MGEESSGVACREEMNWGKKLKNVMGNGMQEFNLHTKRL
jgi:hypothetical protein